MKKYNPKAKCPACGHDTITSLYRPVCKYNEKAYINRYCTRCEYTWEESPLNEEENNN